MLLTSRGQFLSFFSVVLLLLVTNVQATRTSFCSAQSRWIANYTTGGDPTYALAGMTINVAYVPDAPPQSYTYGTDDNGNPIPTGGFLYDVFTTAASIGGFNINWVLTPSQGKVSDDIYLANVTSSYDMVAKASFDTIVRRKSGVGFTPPLVDASLTFIINSGLMQQPYSIKLSFLDPFAYELWGGIVVVIAFHALVQYFFNRTRMIATQKFRSGDKKFQETMRLANENFSRIQAKRELDMLTNGGKQSVVNQPRKRSRASIAPKVTRKTNPLLDQDGHEEQKRQELEEKRRKKESDRLVESLVQKKIYDNVKEKTGLFDFFYYSFLHVTGLGNLVPEQRSERLMSLLFGLFILIIVATYTANLATFLITSNAARQLPITDISKANALRAKVCFRAGAAAYSLTMAQYKGLIAVNSTTTSNIEVLQMLQAGKCDGAVLAHNDWQIAIETQASYVGANVPCNLQSIGRTIRTMYVSLPFKVAHGEPYCTSFLGDVFSAIISQMQASPFVIEALWSNALGSLQQTTCEDVIPLSPTSTSLSIYSMAGLLVWYLVATGSIGITSIILNLLDFNNEQREKDAKMWLYSKLFRQKASVPVVSADASTAAVGDNNQNSNFSNDNSNNSINNSVNMSASDALLGGSYPEGAQDESLAVQIESNRPSNDANQSNPTGFSFNSFVWW